MDHYYDFSGFPSVSVETPDGTAENYLHASITPQDPSSEASLLYESHDLPASDKPGIPRIDPAISPQIKSDVGHHDGTQDNIATLLPTVPTSMSSHSGEGLGDALHSAPILSLSQQSRSSDRVDVPQIANTQGLVALRSTPPTTDFSKPPPRAGFLVGLSDYPFIMPVGPPLNFTITDILVILPLWHKSLQICHRFQNNGLNSSVHVAILREHRDIALHEAEIARAKDGISNQYRKTMRKMDPKWRKTAHKAPNNWDVNNLTVNQFRPDTARDTGYTAPKPISFREMINGIKKLPQGPDAGDLTRALEFALHNQKTDLHGKTQDYLFPDDLHLILTTIGYTVVTKDHTDRLVIFRHENILNQMTNAQRKRRYEQEAAGLPTPPPKRRHVAKAKTLERMAEQQFLETADPVREPLSYGWQQHNAMHSELQQHIATTDASIHAKSGRALVPSLHIHMPTPISSSQLFARAEHFMNGPGPTLETIMSMQDSFARSEELVGTDSSTQPYGTPTIGSDGNIGLTHDSSDADNQAEPSPAQMQLEGADEIFSFQDEMNALIARHQDHDFFGLLTPSPEQASMLVRLEDSMDPMNPIVWENRTQYPNTRLLRDCIEAENKEDNSDLARAARWCHNPHNHAWDYVVGHIDLVLGLATALGNTDS
jgi:hypothetical protein